MNFLNKTGFCGNHIIDYSLRMLQDIFINTYSNNDEIFLTQKIKIQNNWKILKNEHSRRKLSTKRHTQINVLYFVGRASNKSWASLLQNRFKYCTCPIFSLTIESLLIFETNRQITSVLHNIDAIRLDLASTRRCVSELSLNWSSRYVELFLSFFACSDRFYVKNTTRWHL